MLVDIRTNIKLLSIKLHYFGWKDINFNDMGGNHTWEKSMMNVTTWHKCMANERGIQQYTYSNVSPFTLKYFVQRKSGSLFGHIRNL